jgi:hypothetical protein
MTDKVGRNDPCPCGSGKKYKKCCMLSSQQEETQPRLSPRFRFEPGSYGGTGSFLPSIACLEQTAPDTWDYYFVLVDPDRIYTKQKPAVSQAEKDLEAAFLQKEQSGSDYAVGEYLRDRGYVSVTDFKIARRFGK